MNNFDLCSAENSWLKLVNECGGTVFLNDDQDCAGAKWSELTYEDLLIHFDITGLNNCSHPLNSVNTDTGKFHRT